MEIKVLDCTFRDGGYYNDWDFPLNVVNDYLKAMKAAQVDVVELGFRFLSNKGFKGATAYTSDSFLRSLSIPDGLTVGVMANGSDLLTDLGLEASLEKLFPEPAASTPVDLIRFACHFHEFERILPAVRWLANRGYKVGLNLMQVAERTEEEIIQLGRLAKDWPIEVLYFADSMGSMNPDDAARIIGLLRTEWNGQLGIHTHDNMGLALANTLRAAAEDVTWLDSTVTGMGRGPGNARTEDLVIEAQEIRGRSANLVPLMTLIREYFGPMKAKYGWGTNPYYYLTGKYSIHPTYVQEMLKDPRYTEEDILAVIEQLRHTGGHKFSADRMHDARNFYCEEPYGTWEPTKLVEGRDVLLLGTGPGVKLHRAALEAFISREEPLVLALNTQSDIAPELIDLRAACHPLKLMVDSETHVNLPQPLVTPASMLPSELRAAFKGKELLDFGLSVEPGKFAFHKSHAVTPTSLVLAYALAVATSGKANRILMAGFDGYPAGDARNDETAEILETYEKNGGLELISITPTTHKIISSSVYAMEV